MSGLTYDAGALVAAEGNNRRMWALHRRALERMHTPTVPAGVLAQAWRGGPQPMLSRLLEGCQVAPLDEPGARAAGHLLARARAGDVIDASVVVGAVMRGDSVVTGDRRDIASLGRALGRRINIIPL